MAVGVRWEKSSLILAGQVSNTLALSSHQVVGHTPVEGEHRGGGTDLSTHVADGSHAGARDGVDARAEIFDNGTGTALDGQDTGNLNIKKF